MTFSIFHSLSSLSVVNSVFRRSTTNLYLFLFCFLNFIIVVCLFKLPNHNSNSYPTSLQHLPDRTENNSPLHLRLISIKDSITGKHIPATETTMTSAGRRYGNIANSKFTYSPSIIYGTAWKKLKTADYVEEAVRLGFRAIDTACQPKHYHEKGVGDALGKLYSEGFITREDVFLQTKFTSLNGQDPSNIPYDRNIPLTDQVKQSLEKSLENLQTTYLDSLIMHSPMNTVKDTLTVWKLFEEFVREGKVRYIGLSNTYQVRLLSLSPG
jgi:hypothetical protein